MSSMKSAMEFLIFKFSLNFATTFFVTTIILSGLVGVFMEEEEHDSEKCLRIENICPIPTTQVSVYLYTRGTYETPFQLTLDNIQKAPFQKDVPIKILIHGYMGQKDYTPNTELRPAYFYHGEYNIITIDWNKLCKKDCYVASTYNVKPVGTCMAEFLDELALQRQDVSFEHLHIIGFSLGAHVAGFIARCLKNIVPERVTGLDPALPLFYRMSEYGLKVEEAKFIDVIHTNMGVAGKISSVGHVDFYVNGGAIQPGCGIDALCNHLRSVEYFAESINSPVGFWGYPCISLKSYFLNTCLETEESEWELMGEHVNHSARGRYFVITSAEKPFAKGLPSSVVIGK